MSYTVCSEIKLTPREIQLVEKIKCGKPNKIIAYELNLTTGTIKEYLNRIYRKAGVGNRTELAVWAIYREPEQLKNGPQTLP